MERKGEATKHQLAESFKELMLKGSFDKITIRMITCLLYTSDAADE